MLAASVRHPLLLELHVLDGNRQVAAHELDERLVLFVKAVRRVAFEAENTHQLVPDDVSQISGGSSTSNFYLRASGGIQRHRFGIAASLTITPFLTWIDQVKEEAASGLIFSRGGLEHVDPALLVANQKGNFFEVFDAEKTTSAGFAALGTRTPQAFIGQA